MSVIRTHDQAIGAIDRVRFRSKPPTELSHLDGELKLGSKVASGRVILICIWNGLLRVDVEGEVKGKKVGKSFFVPLDCVEYARATFPEETKP
jgi:hypothetical protein